MRTTIVPKTIANDPIIDKKSIWIFKNINCKTNAMITSLVFAIATFVGSSCIKAIFKNIEPQTPNNPDIEV